MSSFGGATAGVGAHAVELQALLHGERAGEDAEEVFARERGEAGRHAAESGGDLFEAARASRELERDVLDVRVLRVEREMR